MIYEFDTHNNVIKPPGHLEPPLGAEGLRGGGRVLLIEVLLARTAR